MASVNCYFRIEYPGSVLSRRAGQNTEISEDQRAFARPRSWRQFRKRTRLEVERLVPKPLMCRRPDHSGLRSSRSTFW